LRSADKREGREGRESRSRQNDDSCNNGGDHQ
jgi:hypothetical protein